MSWMRSFRENPRLHANIGVSLALGLLVAAGGWEARHGEPGRPVSLVLFLVSYSFAAYGCGGYAASKGYSAWWGILPAILGLNLLALEHLVHLPDRVGTQRGGSLRSRLVDALLLLLTAVMVLALLVCAVLAWGERIQPQYRWPGKVGVAICLAYFFWLLCLDRLART